MSVTLHTYTKTEYKNAPDHKTTPLNATNLNNSEDGIDNAYTDIAAVYSEQTSEDAKRALKSDLTSISETGSTASQAISAGTYFYLEGTLVRAKVDIANGATFTLNTNYEVVSAGALNSRGMKLLWSNPSPTASFASQNITLNSADYDFLMVVFSFSSADPEYRISSIVEKSKSGFISYGVSNVTTYRPFTYSSDTSYGIGNANKGAATDNSVLIPVAIYGIKI